MFFKGLLNKILPENLSKTRLSAVYAWKAIAYLNIGSYVEGVESAEHSIKLSPDADFGWKTAGRLYALVRQQDNNWLFKCADFWERFLQKFPHIAEAWAELGFVNWFISNGGEDLRFAEKSLVAFEKSLKLGFEDDGLVCDRLGHLYERKDNHQKAEICYKNAVQINAKDFGYCLGVCLMSLKRHKEALPYLLDAATLYQPDGLSWTNVGVCQVELGNIDEAITSYNKAISLDGNSEIAWFNLGGLYWNKRDVQNAIETWKTATSRFPEHELCKQVYEIVSHFGLLKDFNRTRV